MADRRQRSKKTGPQQRLKPIINQPLTSIQTPALLSPKEYKEKLRNTLASCVEENTRLKLR